MQPRRPFGEYGIQKAAIEAFLIGEARAGGFPATIVHPGHIVGPGWAPLNPAGHFNPRVFGHACRGRRAGLPNFGLETVHHVHADDVAQVFMKAIANWSAAVGEAFHAVSPGSRFAPRLRRDGRRLVRPRGAARNSCPMTGMEDAAKYRRKPRRPGSTSRAARARASPRPSASSAIGRATPRSRPCTRRSPG